MARYVELRRHTDNDGDALTEEDVRAALEIAQQLAGDYALMVSTAAQQATQTLACFACALREPVPGGAVVEPGLPLARRGSLARGLPARRQRRPDRAGQRRSRAGG